MFIGSKPKDLFPRQNKAAADFYRRQQQKRIQAQGPYLVQRSFRRNEGTTDYATIPEVTLAGDFSGSFDFSTVSIPDSTFISGESYQNSSIVIDIKTTEVRLFAYNSVGALQDVVSVLGAFNDGVLHTVQFSLTGNVASLSVDGGNPSTKSWASYDTANISNLYRRANGSNPLPGILANLKIYDNGTLIRDYPLDDNSDILRNRATVLGGNTLLPVLSGSWVDNGDGSYTDPVGYTGWLNLTSVSGVDQLFNYSDITGTVQINNGLSTSIISGTGSIVVEAGTEPPRVQGSAGCTIMPISIRQADGYGTVINGNASDWGLFQQQVTGEWLGQELWTDGIVGSLAPLTILSDSLGVYSEGLSYLYMNNVGLLNANDGTGFNQVSGSTFVRTSSGAIAVRNMSPSESALNFTPSVKEVLNVA